MCVKKRILKRQKDYCSKPFNHAQQWYFEQILVSYQRDSEEVVSIGTSVENPKLKNKKMRKLVSVNK